MSEHETLPPELEEQITATIRDGVSLKIDRNRGPRVHAIYWHPGDPNALAASILEYVTVNEIPLNLNGHRYLIRKAADDENENEAKQK